MTRPTPRHPRPITLIIVCAVIAAAAISAAVLVPGYLRDAPRRAADGILHSFLDDAVSGGDWRDEATALLQGVVPIGAPLRGEPGTADALGLQVSYDVGDLRFGGEDPAKSDTASATVTIRYDYRIAGARGSAAIPQKIWLTRPFYYGDETPRRADAARHPSAIGPWRVTGITLPTAKDLDATPLGEYALRSDDRGPADDVYCYSPAKALAQLADSARIDGRLRSSCFLGAEDGSAVIDESVDVGALISVFPGIDDADLASVPPELMRIEPDALRGMRAPFTQYVIDDTYVLTFAAAKTDAGQLATRLVRIDRVQEGR